MLNKERIKKTVVCYWSAQDETYVAESAMIPHVVIGTGSSPRAALRSFMNSLNDVFVDISADNVAGYKTGRPAKGYVPLNVNVRPWTKKRIAELSSVLEVSRGEVIDYLAFFYDCKSEEQGHIVSEDELRVSLKELTSQNSHLIEKINQLTREKSIPQSAVESAIESLYSSSMQTRSTFNVDNVVPFAISRSKTSLQNDSLSFANVQ